MKNRTLVAVCLMMWTALCVPYPAAGGVYNLHLTTDNGPDYTDIQSLVRTVTAGCDTPQDKCIAIWSMARRSRRQTSNASEDGRLVWDPILHYNSYGTMNCGVVSGLNIACFLELGYQARYIQLGDHTVSEVSWDEGRTWHLFDSSMSFFCYNHDGVVASCEEIKQAHACELSGGRSEPGHYYLYHGAPQCVSHLGSDGWRCASDQPVGYQRTLANGASSYTSGYSVSQYTQYGRFGHRYVLNLLPNQSYTRYFRPLDRDNPDVSEADRPDYFRPLRGDDPDRQHELHNIRSNGVWLFEPALDRSDRHLLFYDDQNVADHASGAHPHVHPAQLENTSFVVLNASTANVITSLRIHLECTRTNPDDSLRILASRTAGIQWQPVWQSSSLGAQQVDLRLRDEVAGVTQCLVKVEMVAAQEVTDVGLDAIQLSAITQVNRRTLPSLTLGSNRVRLSSDQQVDTTTLWPPLHGGRYREAVCDERDISCADQSDGIYKATIGSAVNGQECQATWRVSVPSDIVDVTYAVVATNRSSGSYVTLQHSFDGERYAEFFRKANGAFPFDRQVLNTVAADGAQPSRQAFLRCAFYCRGGAGTYGMDGIQDVMMRVSHQARDTVFAPLEVTYNWTEHRKSGDVTRWHRQRVDALPYEYAINTAGYRDPTVNWVRVKLSEERTPGDATYGYSDGEDVGLSCEPVRARFQWGHNVALGKPYTTSRPAAEQSGNVDREGKELTNGVVVAPTDMVAGTSVQAATAFWTAGEPVTIDVDLGEQRPVAGLRVSTHQPNADYCHPDRVEVWMSDDGQAWRMVGAVRHDDLFCPPVDYEPWEHDDDPRYDSLPAGGRLAYSFPLVLDQPLIGRYVRFVCAPLEGRGVGISELQVFDQVSRVVVAGE